MQPTVNHAKAALHATVRERRESAEECRHCLGVGIQRNCCKNYYCNECYFKGKSCPSCGYMFVRRGVEDGIPAHRPVTKKKLRCGVACGWVILLLFASTFGVWFLNVIGPIQDTILRHTT